MENGDLAIKWVRLNVRGEIFQTTKQTLCKEPDSFFERLFDPELQQLEKDESGTYVIDRDPRCFAVILSYLRTGQVSVSDRNLLPALTREADFYGLAKLVELLQAESKKVTVKEMLSVIKEESHTVILLPTSDRDYDVTKELNSERHFPRWKISDIGRLSVEDTDRETYLSMRNHLTMVATELGFEIESETENECTLVRYVTQ